MKYCPECSSALVLRRIDGVDRKACVSPECSFVHWDNPVPVVAALVQYQDKIILARNSQWPDGMFSLVTGYLERNETPEDAAVREVKEELGLDGEIQEFIGCYSLIEKNQIILAHAVLATGEIKTGNEISEVKLLFREELKRWQFGRLALTAAIVGHWLEKQRPTKRSSRRRKQRGAAELRWA
jgi:NAD+ diphosphatase